MSEEKVSNVGPSKIDIAYERFGDPTAPPVLLVMGLGVQMLGWNEDFCEQLASHGLHVIRFDNRDVGLSTHCHDAPKPNVLAAMSGDTSSASYTLSDMAADSVGFLDALGIESAHIVGASMGGMIAQLIAIEHPTRVRSLTSIMSTTGSRSVGQPSMEAMMLMMRPPPTSKDDLLRHTLDRTMDLSRVINPHADQVELRERTERAYHRSFDPLGLLRQAVAVMASGDRTERLRKLNVPTLVVHGTVDPMCNVTGGKATAEAIPNAELVLLENMGHGLPRALWPDLAARIAALVARANESIQMYFNPSCSKCRSALELLNARKTNVKLVRYLEEQPTREALEHVLRLLKLSSAREMMRTGETLYSELNLANANEEELLSAMIAHPILIERPIVIRGDRAVIARPPEKLLELYDAVPR